MNTREVGRPFKNSLKLALMFGSLPMKDKPNLRAILGLLGGGRLVSTRLRVKYQRESLNLSVLQMAIVSWIPAGGSQVRTSVNCAAHAGGLLGELLAGLALWPKDRPRPEPGVGMLLGVLAGVLSISAIATALSQAFT